MKRCRPWRTCRSKITVHHQPSSDSQKKTQCPPCFNVHIFLLFVELLKTMNSADILYLHRFPSEVFLWITLNLVSPGWAVASTTFCIERIPPPVTILQCVSFLSLTLVKKTYCHMMPYRPINELKYFSLCCHSGGGRVYIRDAVGWSDRSRPRELQTQRHAGFRRDVNMSQN